MLGWDSENESSWQGRILIEENLLCQNALAQHGGGGLLQDCH